MRASLQYSFSANFTLGLMTSPSWMPSWNFLASPSFHSFLCWLFYESSNSDTLCFKVPIGTFISIFLCEKFSYMDESSKTNGFIFFALLSYSNFVISFWEIPSPSSGSQPDSYLSICCAFLGEVVRSIPSFLKPEGFSIEFGSRYSVWVCSSIYWVFVGVKI